MTYNSVIPTERERVFAEAKLDGKTNAEAAMIAAPNIKKISAGKIGNKLLNRPSVQELIATALSKYKITPKKLIKTIAEALEATKETKDGDIVPDHQVRLKAVDMSLNLIGVKRLKDDSTTPPADLSNHELSQALQSNDEVELQRILFKKAE